jgi:hypothetical protein
MYRLLILCKSRVSVHGFFYVKQRNIFAKPNNIFITHRMTHIYAKRSEACKRNNNLKYKQFYL